MGNPLLAFLGGVAGAYSQDITEHPIAAVAGGAIGFYTANKVGKDFSDAYLRMQPNKITMDSISRRRIDVSKATDLSTDNARKAIASELKNVINNPEGLESYKSNLATAVDSKFGEVTDNDQLVNMLESHLDDIYDDRKSMLKLKDVLSNKNRIAAVSAGIVDPDPGKRISMGPEDSIKQIKNKLFSHFTEGLGNNRREAARKAGDMAGMLQGKTTDIVGNTMFLRNKTMDDSALNLTSMSGDLTFSRRNGVLNVVRGVNPEGYNFTENKSFIDKSGVHSKIGIKEVTRKMHPESLVGRFYEASGGNATEQEMDNVIREMNKNTIYAGHSSPGFMTRMNNSIDLGISIEQYMDDGVRKARLRIINTSIVGEEDRSFSSRMMNKISDIQGYNPLTGQGTSALTTITPKEFADTLYNPGLFSSENRGSSSVNYREQRHANISESEFLKVKLANAKSPEEAKGIQMLQHSSAQGQRIQVTDELADIIPHMFGQDKVFKNKKGKEVSIHGRGDLYSIDDGHGLYNASKNRMFAAEQEFALTIGNVGDDVNSRYLLSLGLPEDVMSGSLEDMAAYMGENKTVFRPGDILGYDRQKKAAVIPNYFSSAQIGGIEKTPKGLKLHMIAKYEPKDWVKIFGTSAKSGLTRATATDFSQIGGVALAEGRGSISVIKSAKGGTAFKVVGSGIAGMELNRIYNPLEFLESFAESKGGKALMTEASGATMIQRWSDVGQGGIEKLLLSNESSSKEFIGELMSSAKGRGMDRELDEIAALGFSRKDRKTKADIYRTILTMSDDKSSQDMFLSIGEKVAAGNNSREDVAFLSGLEKQKVNFSKDQIDRLRNLVSRTFADEGMSTTQFTTSLGEAGLGAGNPASVSRLEYSILKSTGMDDDILNSLTRLNRDALQELSMVESVYIEGSFGKSSLKEGSDMGRIMSGAFNVEAAHRRGFLEQHGASFADDATMANYKLMNQITGGESGVEKILSIPISFEDTSHSGLKDYGSSNMIFEIEKARGKVIEADISLSMAITSDAKTAAQKQLQITGESLLSIQGRMMSGENNLRKVAAKRFANNSMMLTARPISGMSDTAEPIAYISENLAKKMYQRMGLKYEDFSLPAAGSSKLVSLYNKTGQELYSQLAREPAQGPYSSIGYKLMVNKGIKEKGDHIFIPKSNEYLNKFAFLDYDADHLRMLPVMDLSKTQTERYMKRNRMMIEGADNLIGMQENLGVKGGFKELNLSTEFNSVASKEKFMLQRAELARLRKTDSPDVTRIVEEFNKALNMEGTGKDLFLGERVLAHNLTENLLKSQHKSTKAGLRGAVQEIGMLQEYMRTGGNQGVYAEGLRDIMDQTLGGKTSGMSAKSQKIYKESLDNLSRIAAKHFSKIEQMGETFSGGQGKLKISSAEAQMAMIEFSSLQSGEGPIPSKVGEIDQTSVSRAAKKGYSAAKAEVMSMASNNKGVLAMGAAGLMGLAMISRDPPEQLASTSPAYNPQETLQPLPDQKGYIRKYSPNSDMSVNASVRSDNSNINSSTLDRSLFGDNIGKVSVNISDKSGMF